MSFPFSPLFFSFLFPRASIRIFKPHRKKPNQNLKQLGREMGNQAAHHHTLHGVYHPGEKGIACVLWDTGGVPGHWYSWCSSSWSRSHGDKSKARATLELAQPCNCMDFPRHQTSSRPAALITVIRSRPPARSPPSSLLPPYPVPSTGCLCSWILPRRNRLTVGPQWHPAPSTNPFPCSTACPGHNHCLYMKPRAVHLRSWMA